MTPIVPRTPRLIWVRDLAAGNMMVDRSIRAERLRPLSLRWTSARKRESQQLRELAGSLSVIGEFGLGGKIGVESCEVVS
jgi:hypothetical protein